MLARAAFLLVTLFWMTMNILLWRQEFGAHSGSGSSVPVETVFQKIITAPDPSALVILYRGKRIGFCQWATGVGESWAVIGDENVPSEIPAKARGYRLRVEGSAFLEGITNRLHIQGELKLSSKRDWQELNATVSFRESTWTIRADARSEIVRMSVDTGGTKLERAFSFSELQNPSKLLEGLLGPGGAEFAEAIAPLTGAQSAGLQIQWEAREDNLRVVHADAKIYRLQTRVLGSYEVTLFVSRVGEILRLELPQQVLLVNDQLPLRETKVRP
jgi:hypothetical protein